MAAISVGGTRLSFRKPSHQPRRVKVCILQIRALSMKHGMTELRSSRRFRTHLEGRIKHDDNAPAIECVLWDLSETGARLMIPHSAEIPLEFELQIPEEGARAKVRLVWSNGVHHGVMFTD